jgi:peptidoglycan/xylan/chitin deacetylase (PgdA/CDA1 family)
MYKNAMGKRVVSLTFDDGPHPTNTSKLMDDLKAANIRATFFVVGRNLESETGKSLVSRAVAEGHQIGNHSYSHPDLTTLTEQRIREEITRTEFLIGDAIGACKLFRPPYGAHNCLVDKVAKELGYSIVLWNVDCLDWHPRYKDGDWVQHAMYQIERREHSVILAHDIHATTVDRLSEFVAQIRNLQDTQFVQYAHQREGK